VELKWAKNAQSVLDVQKYGGDAIAKKGLIRRIKKRRKYRRPITGYEFTVQAS